ncbi:hypothetical protein TPHA_0J00670 [Tetrapisispora phaffii CBS 4417]|uniref:C2H2-type domain-containing protein n=1 Tax=Tetrapisispora phaffii (strain ATCC 24235 / CBS 4417 / NBRC 1672 / NRRL Y-8282 / UCD 70-5) TaxID=1071381 RepID=G8BYE8_TETPH|nr:hypothetical protein TPHA_0J00670 [Tetrapisispora phaffii CBS 4417]CCE64890.1 hypothetical protein TPHA_0J00670 [Tetrapisispora phaffii CBS 4417]
MSKKSVVSNASLNTLLEPGDNRDEAFSSGSQLDTKFGPSNPPYSQNKGAKGNYAVSKPSSNTLGSLSDYKARSILDNNRDKPALNNFDNNPASKLPNYPLPHNSYSSYFTNIVNKVNGTSEQPNKMLSPDWTLNKEIPRELSFDIDTIISQEIPRPDDNAKVQNTNFTPKDSDWSKPSKFPSQGQPIKKLSTLFPTPMTALPYPTSRPQTGNNTPVSSSSFYMPQNFGSNYSNSLNYAPFNLATDSPVNPGTPPNLASHASFYSTSNPTSNPATARPTSANKDRPIGQTANIEAALGVNQSTTPNFIANLEHAASVADTQISGFNQQYGNKLYKNSALANSGNSLIKPLLLDNSLIGYHAMLQNQSQGQTQAQGQTGSRTPVGGGSRTNLISNGYPTQAGQNYSSPAMANTDSTFMNGSSLTPILPVTSGLSTGSLGSLPPSANGRSKVVNILDSSLGKLPFNTNDSASNNGGIAAAGSQQQLQQLPLEQQLYMDSKLMSTISKKHKRGYYKCTHCPETFASIFEYAKHMDSFGIRREYKCPFELCPWKILGLPRRSDLRRHCAIQHKDELSDTLKKELNLNDEMYPILDCPHQYCDKTFIRKDSYNRHFSIVHKEANSRFNKRLAQVLETCPSFDDEDEMRTYIKNKLKNFRRRSSKKK